MNLIQLDLFKTREESELDHLRLMIEDVKKSGDKVRRGMYAKLGDLTKGHDDLRLRLEIIERNICAGIR